jgi:hypothetical protein
MMFRRVVLLAAVLFGLTDAACVPDVPAKSLADATILEHPAIVAAFDEVRKNISALYVNTTRDGLSFAIVSRFSLDQSPAYIMLMRE